MNRIPAPLKSLFTLSLAALLGCDGAAGLDEEETGATEQAVTATPVPDLRR